MKTQRFEPAEAYPTRRSLREAEQRARTSRGRGVKHPEPAPTARETSPRPPLSPQWVPVGTSPNREISPRREASSGRRTAPRGRFVPRVAILGSLAAATTVIPLTGPPTVSANADEGVHYGVTDVLDVLMETEHSPEPTDEDPGNLDADPMAGARAAASASRNVDRGQVKCSSVASSTNGSAAAEAALPTPDLVMPLMDGSYRISSRYGFRSMWGRHSMHAGLDMAATGGTPIHSIADGVVEYTGAGRDGRSSNLIVVRHNINGQIVRSWYVHMYSNGVYVNTGQQVQAGQTIGAVGSNGNSTGPHLHLEIHLDDNLTTTDPAGWLAANGAVALDQETRDCLVG